MAKRTDVLQASTLDTVIGTGVRLRGNMSSDGDISIDGTLAGNIKSGGHVTIGVNARVGGSIHATSARIAGHVEGDVRALDTVSLLETASVAGDIETERLEIELGAIFIGTSKMKPPKATEVVARTEVKE